MSSPIPSINGRPRRRKRSVLPEPPPLVIDEIYGVRLEDPVEVDTTGKNPEPLCKWTEWEFPVPTERGKLQVLDVQGVGRLWNSTDIFFWGSQYLQPARNKARKGRLNCLYGVGTDISKAAIQGRGNSKLFPNEKKRLYELQSATVTPWLIGPLDPKKDSVVVKFPDAMGINHKWAFLTSRAVHIYWGACMSRHFHRPPDSPIARMQAGQRPELVAMRKNMIARILAILDSLPPEWTLFSKTGVVTFPSLSERKVVRLYKSHKYDASGYENPGGRFTGKETV